MFLNLISFFSRLVSRRGSSLVSFRKFYMSPRKIAVPNSFFRRTNYCNAIRTFKFCCCSSTTLRHPPVPLPTVKLLITTALILNLVNSECNFGSNTFDTRGYKLNFNLIIFATFKFEDATLRRGENILKQVKHVIIS